MLQMEKYYSFLWLNIYIYRYMPHLYPFGASGKELTCQYRRRKIRGFDPWVRKIPRRKAWQPTPVFLPEESSWRGAWRTTVHKVTKSRTRMKRLSMHAPSSNLPTSLLFERGRTFESMVSWGAWKKPVFPPVLSLPSKCMVSWFSRVQPYETLRTVGCQAPLSMGSLQARILEWIALPSSKGSSRPRDQIHIPYVSSIGRQVLYHWHPTVLFKLSWTSSQRVSSCSGVPTPGEMIRLGARALGTDCHSRGARQSQGVGKIKARSGQLVEEVGGTSENQFFLFHHPPFLAPEISWVGSMRLMETKTINQTQPLNSEEPNVQYKNQLTPIPSGMPQLLVREFSPSSPPPGGFKIQDRKGQFGSLGWTQTHCCI